MENETIIFRRPMTDEEIAYGVMMNRITDISVEILKTMLENKYIEKNSECFKLMGDMNQSLLNIEAAFFGFQSWGDLVKWKKIHGKIF